MRQLFFIVAFWIVVVVAMRLAVSFPRSLLARVFFTPFGPEPSRGETRSDYLARRARFGSSWFLQSLVLFAAAQRPNATRSLTLLEERVATAPQT